MKKPQPHPRPLPFPAWVKQTYPDKKLLRMIGALDVLYLVYRMGTKSREGVEEIEGKEIAKKMPKTPKSPKKPTTKKVTKKTAPETDLTIEFEHKPEPVAERIIDPAPSTPTEPEPLVLQEEPVIEKPTKKMYAKTMWLDDERLEDADLRKTYLKLVTNGIAVAFETRPVDDEEETVIVINDVVWRAVLTSPSLNLSRMTQIVRVSYGELYVLGRMALGVMSGEGYITASDAAEIVQSLASAEGKTLELDVRYHNKDSTSKKRATHTIRIRFEKV